MNRDIMKNVNVAFCNPEDMIKNAYKADESTLF